MVVSQMGNKLESLRGSLDLFLSFISRFINFGLHRKDEQRPNFKLRILAAKIVKGFFSFYMVLEA